MHALQVVSTPDYTYQDFIEDLRGIVWDSVKETGLSWDDLAIEAKLSPQTVSRFAYGETKVPTSRTVFQIASVVNLRMAFVPKTARRQPDEIVGYPLRSKIRARTETEQALRRIRRRSWTRKKK